MLYITQLSHTNSCLSDWVLLTSNDAYRGEIYLEMTFFGRGPAALARRVSKLPSSERLWRPPQTPPKTPPHANGHLRPPGASSPPRHAQKLSPPKKDEALPSVPVSGGIPDSLRPAAGPRPGGKPQAGLTSVPTILRPGGPSRPASAAKVHRQSGPSYDVSAPAAGPAPQHHVPSGPSYGTAQNAIPQHRTPPPQSYGYTNYNVPAGPDTPPIQSYNHNAAAGHVAPYGPAPAPAPAYTGVDYQRRPSADGVGGDDYVPLSFPEPALPVAANSRAPPAHDRQELLSQRYGSPLPLPANAQVSRPSPQARPPQAQAQAHTQAQTRTQAQSQVPRSHTSSVEVPESYLERERAALERARMEEADADFARRLAAEEETAEGTSVGRTAPPPLPPRSQSKSQEEEDEELARQLARELNSDVLNESRQGENGMPGGW